MVEALPSYLSYLLRLWQVQEGGEDVWRASLRSPKTGEQATFRTLGQLFAFLRRETGTTLASDADSGATMERGGP